MRTCSTASPRATRRGRRATSTRRHGRASGDSACSPASAFIAAPGRRTVLRRPDVGPLTALRAPWRALTIGPCAPAPSGRPAPGVADAVDELRPRRGIATLLRGAGVARLRQATATSAGGIVIRFTDGAPELVVGKRRRERDGVTWTLPKGTPDAARDDRGDGRARGPRGDRPRGPHRPAVRLHRVLCSSQGRTRIHKTVHYFLMVPTGGDLGAPRPRVRRGPLDRRSTRRSSLLTFETERALVARAAAAATDGAFPGAASSEAPRR